MAYTKIMALKMDTPLIEGWRYALSAAERRATSQTTKGARWCRYWSKLQPPLSAWSATSLRYATKAGRHRDRRSTSVSSRVVMARANPPSGGPGTGAAAMGMEVALFHTFWGLMPLRKGRRFEGKGFLEGALQVLTPAGMGALSPSRLSMFGAGAKVFRRLMKQKEIQSPEELLARLRDLDSIGVPYTNYGIFLASMQGPQALRWNRRNRFQVLPQYGHRRSRRVGEIPHRRIGFLRIRGKIGPGACSIFRPRPAKRREVPKQHSTIVVACDDGAAIGGEGHTARVRRCESV